MDHNQEIECIRAVLKGNTNQFALLVTAYQSGAYNLSYKILGNSEDARDCTQDAFVQAYQALGKFRLDSRFSTWLYRIVYNTCISKTRKESRSVPFTPDSSYYPESMADNDGIGSLDHGDMRMLLDQAYKVLSPDEIFLIDQYYREDATVDELAEMTSLSASNVKVRLFRARQKMHQVITSVLKEEIEIWQTR
ncbi:MAG: hypothetical protein A2X22_07815 [Bacteroidetes bacterium GWF2_49_14]|nr:MAG: hypothetical protein A2X22_07815 [Bacteroidetes bacterium GWF2_49_14]HBB90781.1 hypothetical protein [Bacteroidales bacterium]